MEDTKDEISFSVNFLPTKNIKERDMKLTFFGNEKPFPFDEKFELIPFITKIIQMSKHGQNIPNIVDVIPNSERYSLEDFLSLYVLLFDEREPIDPHRTRSGYLIGLSKDKKAEIIGLWPHSFYQEISGKFDGCIDKLKELINNPDGFKELLMLTQK